MSRPGAETTRLRNTIDRLSVRSNADTGARDRPLAEGAQWRVHDVRTADAVSARLVALSADRATQLLEGLIFVR